MEFWMVLLFYLNDIVKSKDNIWLTCLVVPLMKKGAPSGWNTSRLSSETEKWVQGPLVLSAWDFKYHHLILIQLREMTVHQHTASPKSYFGLFTA